MEERQTAGGDRRIGRAVGERLSYANVMSTIAVFLALGGSGLAVASHLEVFSSDLVDGEVKNNDLAANSVGSNKIVDRSVKNADLSIGASSSNTIADRGIQAIDVKLDTLTGTEIDESTLDPCGAAVAGTGEMVEAGSICIDKYEASVWTEPDGGTQLVGDAAIDAACPDNGQPSGTADCQDFYARSVAGVEPARPITWFQAQQALANSGKRLPQNAEWQQAVAGTPDSTACNVDTGSVANTGANAGCVSRFGAFDMVGNVWEWVADWVPLADDCASWPAGFGSDLTCFGDDPCSGGTSRFPGALIRGGFFSAEDFGGGAGAGPFAVGAPFEPSIASPGVGFRGAR